MTACTSCGCHVRAADSDCPHCGATMAVVMRRTGAALLLGLTLAPGCGTGEAIYGVPDTAPQAEYGVADTGRFADDDADGWTEAEGDCNDADDTVFPEATETAGDEIDSNCDGADDT